MLTSLTNSPPLPLHNGSGCMWARCRPLSGTLPPTPISISSFSPRSPDERPRLNGRRSASARWNSGAKAKAWGKSAPISVRRDTPSLNHTWRPFCEARGFYRCGGEADPRGRENPRVMVLKCRRLPISVSSRWKPGALCRLRPPACFCLCPCCSIAAWHKQFRQPDIPAPNRSRHCRQCWRCWPRSCWASGESAMSVICALMKGQDCSPV